MIFGGFTKPIKSHDNILIIFQNDIWKYGQTSQFKENNLKWVLYELLVS